MEELKSERAAKTEETRWTEIATCYKVNANRKNRKASES